MSNNQFGDYDTADAAYLFKAMNEIYQATHDANPIEIAELDHMTNMFAASIHGAEAINKVVDFSAGWEGVFAYEVVDQNDDSSLAHAIYHACVLGEATPLSVVADYATSQNWPLNAQSTSKTASPAPR